MSPSHRTKVSPLSIITLSLPDLPYSCLGVVSNDHTDGLVCPLITSIPSYSSVKSRTDSKLYIWKLIQKVLSLESEKKQEAWVGKTGPISPSRGNGLIRDAAHDFVILWFVTIVCLLRRSLQIVTTLLHTCLVWATKKRGKEKAKEKKREISKRENIKRKAKR